MRSLTQKITHQLQRHYQDPLFRDAGDSWYTGADILEDLTLCKTSLKQQNVQAGQTILVSPTQTATIPILLLASWQLGLTVTLTPPSHKRPELAPQAYAAMVYSTVQTTQLALDPHEISLLTLILNTAPHFTYLVHDQALTMERSNQVDLILPANHVQLTQSELFNAASHHDPQTELADLYNLDAGLIPCLANLLTATPFTLMPTQKACLPS